MSAPTNLDAERTIRAVMRLLEAMGAQGEGYDHHERAFRELDDLGDVIRGAERVAEFAAGMLARSGPGDAYTLTDRVRADNGLRAPRFDQRCEDLAAEIRRRRGDVLGTIHDVRERHRIRMTVADLFELGPPPKGHWVEDEDDGDPPAVVISLPRSSS